MPSTSKSDEERNHDVSRRGFIATVGAGAAGAAGALTFGAGAARAEATAGLEAGSSAGTGGVGIAATPADRFGRIFPQLPSFVAASDRNRAALIDIGKVNGLMDARDNLAAGPVQLIVDPALSANNRDNPRLTAGVTFLGQFLDHDLTFDNSSPLGIPTEPQATPNIRTPALDLDSVYGAGPAGSPQLYSDGIKLRIENGGLFEDLPRQANGTAIIADPRNDENLMIAGIQAAMILAHNRLVDDLAAQGVPANQRFERARQQLMWHYQWMVLNEFLPLICGDAVVNDVMNNGRRYYLPEPGPAFIPIEWQGAAYRFGHSLVRPSYRANLAGDPNGTPATGAPAFFGMIFDPAGEGQADPVDLRGGRRARRRFIGWQTFFDFGGNQTTHVRQTKRIDTRISTPLFRLPLGTISSGQPPVSLAQRNLLRHLTWSVPSGQRIAQTMGAPMLHRQELATYGIALENQTPLWYYVMAEAEALQDGLHLGPVGGRIVAEVFVGVVELDARSYIGANPSGWRPTLPSQTPGNFKMTDLLRYARVDPASRGQ